MRFPFSLTRSMGFYMARKTLSRAKHFPMVLMLEPLHACNLHCQGCGRIREYPETIGQRMSLDDCLASVDECGAPIVSICGGEPLLYQELPELIDGIIRRGKHIYLCSNGLLLEDKLETIASIPNKRLKECLYFNIHLDGLPEIHDRLTGRPGTFQKCVEGIKKAKEAGFCVYVNSTVYRETSIDDLIGLAEILSPLGLDGMMISPAYSYEAVLKEENSAKTGPNSEESPLPVVDEKSLFMTRDDIHAFFREVRHRMKRYRLTATPIFFDFLCGVRELNCAAWANPTRNIRGWRSPCYLIADTHYPTWRELVEKTDWSKIGPAHDPRCQNCLTHCGFEPAAVLAANSPKEILRLAVWEMTAPRLNKKHS